MSSTDTSSSSLAGSTDLSAAIAALTDLIDGASGLPDFSPVGIKIGDLRALAAALNGIHIPGHVEKDWAEIPDTPAEHWTVARYQAGRMFATERHYFVPAVQS